MTAGATNPAQLRLGLTPDFELGTVDGETFPSVFGVGNLHSVALAGLAPGTTYYYSVSGDPNYEWSAVRSFTTPPDTRDVSVRFLAVGDSRPYFWWPLGNLEPWGAICRVMAAEPSDFLLFGGDLTFDGITRQFWYEWFERVEPLASFRPLMACPGNHEFTFDPNGATYRMMFVLPEDSGSEFWYSFDYGPLHVVSLTSELATVEAQTEWLAADLARATAAGAPWIIVLVHDPLYTSGRGHGPDSEGRDRWVPLFDEYGVSLVITGHNHFYLRTFPLYGGEQPASPQIVDQHPTTYWSPPGTIYVISGAAGAPTLGYDPDNSEGFVAAYAGQIDEYCRFVVDGPRSLHMQCVSAAGELLDEFWIYKEGSPTPAPSPSPAPSPTPEPPTPVPSSTPTPTASPTPSPTRTPGPVAVRITVNQSFYQAGDEFRLSLGLRNPKPEPVETNVYVALELNGQVWFWPEWNRQPDTEQRILPSGCFSDEILMEFTWPAGAGTAQGLRFWAALTTPDTNELLDHAVIEWGFSS